MARTLEGVRTWWHDPNLYNITQADAVVLSDGRIVIGFAGADNSGQGLVSLGILDQAGDTLTSLGTSVYPGTPGGFPVSSVRGFDLQEGPGGRLSATLFLTESEVGADTNFAMLLQRFNGTAATGTAVAVDPATTANPVNQHAAIVYDAQGGARVFWTESATGQGQSTGIRMASFAPNGAAVGTPVTVVADHLAGGIISAEANPIMVDATAMKNGNIALTWTESSAFAAPSYGQPKVMLQVIRPTGAAVGAAIEIDGTSAQQSQIVALKGGGMVVAWLDFSLGDQGIYKAQMLTATGALRGGVFEISSTFSTQEHQLEMVALDNGGWAALWKDMTNQTYLARLFDAAGTAASGDFLALDSVGDFLNPTVGMVAHGNELIVHASGLNRVITGGFVMQGQTFSTGSSLGQSLTLGSGDDSVAGGGLDDRLSGAGGMDTLRGNGGSDTLEGGSGRDDLNGGDGVDQIAGGAGGDRLTGGRGPDSFIYRSSAEGGDRITDFDGAGGDRLIFTKAGFGGATGILSGAVTDTAHMGLFFNTATGVLSYDADGAGSAARVTIATLTGVTALAWDDALFM